MTIHKEGYRIIATSFFIIAIPVALFYLFTPLERFAIPVSIAGAALFLLILSFFRSPGRIPVREKGSIIAPADGRIVIVKEVYEGEYFKGTVVRSLYLYFQCSCKLVSLTAYYKYHPERSGCNSPEIIRIKRKNIRSGENESVILFRQIAGSCAQNCCYAKEGNLVQAGEETGFIKFGSRVDLFLPLNSKILVKRGMAVKGCRTVIATIPK